MGLCWSEPPIQQKEAIQYTYSVQPSYIQAPQSIEINVRTLTGTNLPLTAYITETIYQLKQRIYSLTGIHPERQVLMFGGRQLENSNFIYMYSIPQGAIVHLVIRMV